MRTGCLSLLALGLVAAGPALAAEVRFDSRVGLTALLSDNYFLAASSASKQSVTTGLLDLSGTMSARTQTSSFLLQPRGRFSKTSPDVGQNANDGFLTLVTTHTGLESNAALSVNYSHQSLNRLNMPSGDIRFDLGAYSSTQLLRLITSHNSQDLLQVNPSGNWNLTERTQLRLGGYFTDSSYKLNSLDYIDYRSSNAYAGLGFNVTRLDTVAINLSGTRFQPAKGSDSDTYGLSAQWDRRISEVSRYYFRLGNERTRFGGTNAAGVKDSASSVSAGAGVSWAYQITGLFLDATRNVYGSSVGTPVAQTELRVRVQRLFSPRTSGWLSLQGAQYDNLGATTNADGSRFLTANFGLEWRFAKTWSLVPSAYLVQQRLNANASSAHSNEVQLTLVYEPGRKAQAAAVRVQ